MQEGIIMKRLCVVLALFILLAGCAKQADFETIADDLQVDVGEPDQITVWLPEEAAVPVMEDDAGATLYLCEHYSVTSQTLQAGDLAQTITEITGFSPDAIDVVSTQENGMKRYDLVWASAGEEGIQTCRAAVLDDGNYHYVLSAMGNGAENAAFSSDWQRIFDSLALTDTD